MKKLLFVVLLVVAMMACSSPQHQSVEMPGASPLVTFKIVFQAGAASDPAGREGVAALTAAMLSQGGTREISYNEIVDRMFPLATSVSSQVDKEMTTFSAVTHVDNLEEFYGIFRAMLLDPGWREEDLKRLRDEQINFLRVSLRGNNDEELGKEVLYQAIYEGHPYVNHNAGMVSGLESITMDDLRAFYRDNYTQANLILGVAGGYDSEFLARVEKDFAALPKGTPPAIERPAPKPIHGIQVRMIEKNTRSVAYSIGFPIEVTRGHPDYVPLLVAQSYLGQHRTSVGRLYQRMRHERGLNYGDYAYIEYYPRGMFQLEPDPNLARLQQIFQIWIRPLEPATAHFALRLAMFELNRLVTEGLSEEDFENARGYLSKYVNLLTKTKNAELGYAIDSQYYGIQDYNSYLKAGLADLRVEDVNAAVKKHLRTDDLWIAVVANDCEGLKAKFLAGEPSPMTYNSEKPAELLEEDKTVEKWEIPFTEEGFEIIPEDRVFE